MLTAQELTFYCTPHTIQAAENGHKSLVFSSFTTMLELLQAEAERRGLHTLYLSGRDCIALFELEAATAESESEESDGI